MSIEVMNLVWKSHLPTTEKMVLLVIADHAHDDGKNSWPSIGTIARKASISPRSAQRYVARLAAEGWITIQAQQGGTIEMRDDRRPNLYEINLERLNGATAETPRHGVTTACHGVTDSTHGVTDRASRGDNSNSHGVTPMSPKPSLEPYIEPPITKHSRINTFDTFWARYPRKVGKRNAARRWYGLKPDQQAAALAAIDAHVAHWQRNRTETRFIPHPATWLNAERWNDVLTSDTPQPSAPSALIHASHLWREALAAEQGNYNQDDMLELEEGDHDAAF